MHKSVNYNNMSHPLVTFALFAYNQERFISEAVQGALSQTYTPLEIILSDDCSTDRTFEIMQDMATQYQGPHTIVLNRNQRNLGLVGHINRVMDIAKGELIVAAAGDDISLPKRVSRIVQAYLDSGKRAFSIHSSIQIIDENGNFLKQVEAYPSQKFSLPIMAERTISVIGNSHAWHRICFDLFGPIDPRVIQEDVIIPFRAALLGEVIPIHEILVLRRYHTNNIWLHPRRSNFREELAWHSERVVPRINNLQGLWETKIRDLSTLIEHQPSKATELEKLRPILEKRLEHNFLEREFYLANSIGRVKMLQKIIKNGVPLARLSRWVAQYWFPPLFYGIRRIRRFLTSLKPTKIAQT